MINIIKQGHITKFREQKCPRCNCVFTYDDLERGREWSNMEMR